MLMLRNDFAGDLKVDLNVAFFQSYSAVDTVHDKIFNVKDSDAAYEKMTSGNRLGLLKERPEGNDIVFSKPTGGLVVYGKNRTFSDGFQMSEEAVEDVKVENARNKFIAMAAQWGESYRESQEEFAAKFFNFGGYTAGHEVFNNTITGEFNDPGGDLLWDGKPFFNLVGNLRTTGGGQTYYNSHALTPTLTNLQTMYLHGTVTNAYDEWGRKVSLRPNVILSNGALRFTIFPILNSQQVPGSGNNDTNPLYKLLEPIEWGELTDTDAFFMGTAKKGLEWRNRLRPVIDFYQDPKNRSFYATVNARWGAWVSDWRYWQASQISTS